MKKIEYSDSTDSDLANERISLRRAQITSSTQGVILTVLGALAVPAFILGFYIGSPWWPQWVLDERGFLLGMLIFVIICLGAVSPLLVEVNVDPRPLNGPGTKNNGSSWK